MYKRQILLKAYNQFSGKKDFKLFICPRHIERSQAILKEATALGFKAQLFSEFSPESCEICIVDSTGLLQQFYVSASMAFVGGSLVPRGGHNLIEPAALGTPIIIGSHTFNFEEIVKEFLDNQACIEVISQDELLDAIEFFAIDLEASKKYAIRAKEIIEKNKGSTEVQASYIIKQLGEKS